MMAQKFNFHNCRGLFKCCKAQMKPFSLQWKSCGGVKSPVEVVQACFSAVQVLKFSFHHCIGRVIPVDACLSDAKIRESGCFHCLAGPV